MTGITPLSTGCLEVIMSGNDFDKPILQILSAKRIPGVEGTERYRLLVSDGKYLNSFTMLGTQLNDQYSQGKFSDYTIVRVDRYIVSAAANKSDKGTDKRVLIFLELTVLNPGSEVGERIGTPVPYNPDSSKLSATKSTTSATNTAAKTNNEQGLRNFGLGGINNGSSVNSNKPASSFSNTLDRSNNSSMMASSSNQDISHAFTQPIAGLSPYVNKWVIKVRVTSKSPIRTWSNAKGEGKLFSMDLMDESGEIRATAFRDQCDKYYDLIQVDKIYYISKGSLKPANKQYTTIQNDYELAFTNETVVQLCEDMNETGIPQVQYNFVPISQIASIEPKAVVDVIGVCKEASELQVFTGKTNNREYKKRDLTLVDTSNASVVLAIWGDEAANFDGFVQPVVLIKGARVTEFGGGKTLSLGAGSTMKINPDIPEGHKLRGWFDNGGAENISNSVSSRTPGTGTMNTEWLTFYEAQMRNLGAGDKADYFQNKATVHIIKNMNAFYKACPQQDCNKKVIDEENGHYRCEKCNAVFPNFKYRLLLNMSIGDWMTNRWVTCFNEVGEELLGKSAQEIGTAIENNPAIADEIFGSINFSEFIFKLRTKIELFGDTQRSRITIMNASKVNYKEYNRYAIKQLQELTGVGKMMQ